MLLTVEAGLRAIRVSDEVAGLVPICAAAAAATASATPVAPGGGRARPAPRGGATRGAPPANAAGAITSCGDDAAPALARSAPAGTASVVGVTAADECSRRRTAAGAPDRAATRAAKAEWFAIVPAAAADTVAVVLGRTNPGAEPANDAGASARIEAVPAALRRRRLSPPPGAAAVARRRTGASAPARRCTDARGERRTRAEGIAAVEASTSGSNDTGIAARELSAPGDPRGSPAADNFAVARAGTPTAPRSRRTRIDSALRTARRSGRPLPDSSACERSAVGAPATGAAIDRAAREMPVAAPPALSRSTVDGTAPTDSPAAGGKPAAEGATAADSFVESPTDPAAEGPAMTAGARADGAATEGPSTTDRATVDGVAVLAGGVVAVVGGVAAVVAAVVDGVAVVVGGRLGPATADRATADRATVDGGRVDAGTVDAGVFAAGRLDPATAEALDAATPDALRAPAEDPVPPAPAVVSRRSRSGTRAIRRRRTITGATFGRAATVAAELVAVGAVFRTGGVRVAAEAAAVSAALDAG